MAATRVMGANDRLHVGLMGSGGRGSHVTRRVHAQGNAAIVALADVNPARFAVARKNIGLDESNQPAPTEYRDFRALLDRKDIDAVVIGSPDHWHVPMTIAAVQAGKDVYVEKPLTHNVAEGEQVIQVVEASDRIVQVGYQQRSYPHMIQARELMQSGGIGQVTQVLTWWNQSYLGTQQTPELDAASIDWQAFLGTACPRPFNAHRYRYWRWFWDYGGGTLTDLYSHWVDAVHWIMGHSVPLETQGQSQKYVLDWLEAPDTVNLSSLYPGNFQITYQSTMATRMEDGGMLFRGTKGSMRLTRPMLEVYPEEGTYDKVTWISKPSLQVPSTGDGTADHVQNWLDCIRSRKQPSAPVRSSVDSANAAHWGNEALRSGKRIIPNQLSRPWKHLFDGKTLDGWVQDTPNVWSVRNGMIVGKHNGQKWNDFLRTKEQFDDFELDLEFRLVDGKGNSGIQFRSDIAAQEHELVGYQADIGEKYWGCLYDESRRNKVLVQAPLEATSKLDLKGWHRYQIHANGNYIALTLDGMRTVTFVEADREIPGRGIIALQVHSGPGIEVQFRNIRLRPLS